VIQETPSPGRNSASRHRSAFRRFRARARFRNSFDAARRVSVHLREGSWRGGVKPRTDAQCPALTKHATRTRRELSPTTPKRRDRAPSAVRSRRGVLASGARPATVTNHRHRRSGADANADADAIRGKSGEGFTMRKGDPAWNSRESEGRRAENSATPPPETPRTPSGGVEASPQGARKLFHLAPTSVARITSRGNPPVGGFSEIRSSRS
jgi:hypothetical protein